MNIQENNILIAEFMAISKRDKTNDLSEVYLYESPITGEYVEEHEINYDDSWDWLMPVIQKCYEDIAPFLDGENGIDENLIGDISTELLDGRITECYEAVCKAIILYNQKH
tara:strand:- start:577 stop:909 length:333 start_codon:yes stop_codon:yes gene_type:complete